ncbi:DNA-directed DNA polymerase [Fragilaria crotonensis]|nr:DNA-directed DNA polymerase [Fragilaria crotonensis]
MMPTATRQAALMIQLLKSRAARKVRSLRVLFPIHPDSGDSQPVASDIETPEMMARLGRQIERDALVWNDGQALDEKFTDAEDNLAESNPVPEQGISIGDSNLSNSNSSGVQQPIVIDLLGDDDSKVSPIKQSLEKIESFCPSIMFVELGRGLTKGQIRFLTTVVAKKGLRVVHTLDSKPTYMVVDAFVNVETLAQFLNFKGVNKVDNLKKVVSEHNITPVKPTWITNNKGPTIRPPKIAELYNGLIVDKSTKRMGSLKRLDPPKSSVVSRGDDLVVEVPANGGKVVRNVEIADLFRKLAKIYQKAIIETHDEFRAYTFNLVAGRLNELDFEILSDPAAMSKLGGIPGFGGSSLGMIKEWIKTRTIERIHFLETEERRVATRNLIKIWGIGPKTAHHLYNNNFRTIRQVRGIANQ